MKKKYWRGCFINDKIIVVTFKHVIITFKHVISNYNQKKWSERKREKPSARLL